MAFPTTVTTNVNPYHGIGGPYCNVAGTAVYIFGRSDANADQIQAYKATDPASSFVGVGSNPAVSNTIRQIAGYQVGDVVHFASRDAGATNSNQIRYHAFNMATDTWTTASELVKTTYTQAGSLNETVVTILARSGGDKIIAYEGPQVLADIQRSRAYYARHLGVAWSADIALDNGGNVHWLPQETILGSSNRVHFFLLDRTNEDLYQRTLNSANALETFPAAFDTDTNTQTDLMVQRGVAYSASAGGTVVLAPYFNTYAGADCNDVRFTSADAPSPLTIRTDITGAIDPLFGLARRMISYAADGNTVYGIFNDTSSNVYLQSSQDASAWSTPALLIGGGGATSLYSSVFTRGGSRKLGIVYYVGTSLMYTEYLISLSPSLMTDAPDRLTATGYTLVRASMSATAAADKFSASGNVIAVIKTGSLSARDAPDTFVGLGYNNYPTTIRFDNAAFTSTSGAVTSFGLLLTATSNACLVVFVAGGDHFATVSSVAIGATQLTFLGSVTDFGGRNLEAWGLTAPPAGVLTISATIVGGGAWLEGIAAATYTGHKTTGSGPFGTVTSGTAAAATSASLIVPSTAGNVVVFGISYDFSVGVATAGYTMRQRGLTGNSEWPDILIADRVSWGANVTGSATAASNTQWGLLGVNLLESGAGTTTGLAAFTDTTGTLSASGYAVARGRMSATDVVGTFSATGYAKVSGRLSATEGYTDTFAVSATTITPVHGSIAWTMPTDTMVANPRQPAGLTPGTLSNAGGGAGAKNKENIPWPTDLWDAREAYLLSLYPEGPHPAPELEDNAKAWQEYEDRKQQLVNLTAERAHAIIELRESPDVATMKQHGAHIKELTAKIATLTGKQDFARFMRRN